ncbi:MAG: type II toxin-antitoxin system VapC family toxin [Chlorobi bacterium]|nr:type II toxin-antitoxin system VapC family toxin [Chlorobiota bacterium]
MNNILLDTNLLIYAIDEDSKYYNSVHKLFDDESNNLFTTSKNISEFLSVITRYPEKSISIKDALIVIEELKSIFTVLYPTEKSNLIFIDLLKEYSPHGLKIHDYEIISIALSYKINRIATVNKKDFTGIKEIELVTV